MGKANTMATFFDDIAVWKQILLQTEIEIT